ncbi:type II secretion system minor pseudopilin GspK [Variovorax sp. UC122_21]|uniref:type II secretion system minor pseudopilin GspK n=1 Tax=Variovorax sp. UC122_21 TaxID=3374554 RepID=UPI003757800A
MIAGPHVRGSIVIAARGHRARQRGMAVVSALFIVALIAALAAVMMNRQSAAIRDTQGEQSRVQARWLLRGELGAAQQLLRAEATRDPTTRLDGAWSRPSVRPAGGLLAVEGGARLVSEISDEQGKYNLRNLVERGRIDPIELGIFQRLCASLGVPATASQAIARRIALSFGDDESATSGSFAAQEGAVDPAAAAAASLGLPLDLPRQPRAPRPRAVEDLLATAGVDAAAVARLAPFVTVLPFRTWINANTASAELVAAGVPGLSLERARELLAARDRGQWFINTGDFSNRLRMPELDALALRIGVTSNWFRVASMLETPRTKFLQTVLLLDDKASLPRVMWLREGA